MKKLSWMAVIVLALAAGGAVIAMEKPPASEKPAEEAKAPAKNAKAESAPALEDVALGKENAPILIIEYASLSCPHCAKFHQEVFPQIQAEYIDKGIVRFIYRDYPLNLPALHGAMIARCAGKERFYTFLKVLFSMQDKWAFESDHIPALKKIALLGGMNEESFGRCLADKSLETAIIETRKVAADEHKIDSTPSFLVNGKLWAGAKTYQGITDAIANTLVPKDSPKPQ